MEPNFASSYEIMIVPSPDRSDLYDVVIMIDRRFAFVYRQGIQLCAGPLFL